MSEHLHRQMKVLMADFVPDHEIDQEEEPSPTNALGQTQTNDPSQMMAERRSESRPTEVPEKTLGKRNIKTPNTYTYDCQLQMAINESKRMHASKQKKKYNTKMTGKMQAKTAKAIAKEQLVASKAEGKQPTSPSAIQALRNINSFNFDRHMHSDNEDSSHSQYDQYIQELKSYAHIGKVKVLRDLPPSVLRQSNQNEKTAVSTVELPKIVEFAIRYVGNASCDKLITVPVNMRIAHLKQYILASTVS